MSRPEPTQPQPQQPAPVQPRPEMPLIPAAPKPLIVPDRPPRPDKFDKGMGTKRTEIMTKNGQNRSNVKEG